MRVVFKQAKMRACSYKIIILKLNKYIYIYYNYYIAFIYISRETHIFSSPFQQELKYLYTLLL
jgi:hypothetical protein